MSTLVVSHIFCYWLKVHITFEYIDSRLEVDISRAIASGVALVENSVLLLLLFYVFLSTRPSTLCYNNCTFS